MKRKDLIHRLLSFVVPIVTWPATGRPVDDGLLSHISVRHNGGARCNSQRSR